MEVHLTPDQESFVRQAIESGRLHRAEDAVEEALCRFGKSAGAHCDEAEASWREGEVAEAMRLAEEVKQRRPRRLATEQTGR